MAKSGSKIIFFPSAGDFREWLQSGHTKSNELWVGFYQKSSGKRSITYPEAVDEALCFGWIDGIRKKVARNSYTVRFTPRRPQSQWSAVNVRRVQELAGSGRMQPAGLKAFETAASQGRKYSYEQQRQSTFDSKALQRFRENRKAWEFFRSQAPWYQRTATFWVVSAKKEETRQRRLATLIADCERGVPIKPLSRTVPKRKAKMQ